MPAPASQISSVLEGFLLLETLAAKAYVKVTSMGVIFYPHNQGMTVGKYLFYLFVRVNLNTMLKEAHPGVGEGAQVWHRAEEAFPSDRGGPSTLLRALELRHLARVDYYGHVGPSLDRKSTHPGTQKAWNRIRKK